LDHQNFDKLKDAYDACMDESTIKKAGIKPLTEILHQVADIFPATNPAIGKRTALTTDKDNEDIATTILFLSKLGVSALVSLGAGADDKDPDTVVVQASPPRRIGLPAKDYYKDPKVVEKYTKTLAQIIASLHSNGNADNALLAVGFLELSRQDDIAVMERSKDYAEEVVEFEKKLATASPDAEDSNDVTVSKVKSPWKASY
jgi:endothelin-converting enzyme